MPEYMIVWERRQLAYRYVDAPDYDAAFAKGDNLGTDDLTWGSDEDPSIESCKLHVPRPSFQEGVLLIAKAAPQPQNLMGSIWGKAEAEFLIWETIQACAINWEQHKRIFSFKGDIQNSPSGLANNLTVYNELVSHGWFREGEFESRPIIIPADRLVTQLLIQLKLMERP